MNDGNGLAGEMYVQEGRGMNGCEVPRCDLPCRAQTEMGMWVASKPWFSHRSRPMLPA